MKNWLRTNKGFLAMLLLLGVFRTAVADWNPIPSSSMHPNLLEGDVVFVNRLAFNLKLPLTNVLLAHTGEPQRGDVVTFFSPTDGTRLIKRLIALPGDRVEMRNELLVINGKPADYTAQGTALESIDPLGPVEAHRFNETVGSNTREVQFVPSIGNARRDFGPIVVPNDHYLMLGDNRDNSADSRYIGFVPRELLIGRAEKVLVSADIRGNWAPRPERFGMSLH